MLIEQHYTAISTKNWIYHKKALTLKYKSS